LPARNKCHCALRAQTCHVLSQACSPIGSAATGTHNCAHPSAHPDSAHPTCRHATRLYRQAQRIVRLNGLPWGARRLQKVERSVADMKESSADAMLQVIQDLQALKEAG